MRGSRLGRSARTRRARIFSVPAPVRGWNARDQVDQLSDTEASRLDNFLPRPNSVDLRDGSVVASRAVDGAVSTIMEFNSRAARIMVAAGNGRLTAIDAPGLGTGGHGTVLATGYASDRHDWVMFKEHLLGVNGADPPWRYDGSVLSANSFSGSFLVPADLAGIAAHRTRLYLWEAERPWFWYGGTDAIAGALVKFDLARIARRGGNLVAVESWTRDSGDGVDDLACFFMSSGDCIVYQGSDPGDADNWSLIGVFPLGAPVDRRAVIKYGGDILVVTRQGILSLNTVLPLGRTRGDATITDRISGAFFQAVREHAGIAGWQLIHYPRGSMLLCNVPQTMSPTTVQSTQLVMNTDTGAWARFSGIDARCLGIVDDRLYAGGLDEGIAWDEAPWDESPWAAGLILQLDTGNADLQLDQYGNAGPAEIIGRLRTKFFTMGAGTLKKRFTMVRPVLESDGVPPFELAMSVDGDTRDPGFSAPTITAVAIGDWDAASWDIDDWAGGTGVLRSWQRVSGLGYSGALNLRVATQIQDVRLRAIDFMFEPGGVL